MSCCWPKAIEEGLVLTDNGMGTMTEELSPAAVEFVERAASAERPLLDVGAAYGNATIPALRSGATVIANDLSITQLQVLEASADAASRRRLILMPARFPEEIRLAEGSLGAVLAAQVLHFLDGAGVELAFQSVFRWLVPGARFHAVVITPSLSYYVQTRPEYERRVRAGERWPGIFNPRTVATPEWRDRLPDMIHLFEADVLRRCATEAGFTVETLEYFCYTRFPDKHRTDGREYLSLTARKPA